MNGYAHRVLGVCAGLAAGHAGVHWAAWPWPQALACGALAPLTAGGPCSPDVDLTRAWALLDRILPDELLGNHGPLQHRGISHWWGLPAAATPVLAVLAPSWWPAWALLAGWTSHLAGDWAFGRAGQGRGPGIPFAPWWNHHGPGWCASGGTTAHATTVLLHYAALAYGLALSTGHAA